MENTLQARIKKLQQEVLALKTAKKAGLLIISYSYNESAFNISPGLYKITYEDGNQPIITFDYSSGKGTMFAPEGNEQYIYYLITGVIELNLQSTRPIISVEYISS